VIHIATVHFRHPGWIDLQLRHLARQTNEPYRTYASLERIDPEHQGRFDQVIDHTGRSRSLAACVNEVGERITHGADADDLLVFMHADVFPIADWVGHARRMLAEAPLAAIRRDENYEPVPHWSFCVTTVGFWSEIGGDWSRGPVWDPERGSDMGAVLWRNLEERGIEWHPILRSNKVDLHPVFFGVYGDLVYHHGAGSRTPMTWRDSRGYAHLPVPLRNFAGVRRRIANGHLGRKMLRRIRQDDRFYLALTAPAGT
jgi:hypothetical protein